MYKNGKVTLYRLTGGGYERSVHDAFVTDNKISNFNKTGLTTADSLFCMIPYDSDMTFKTGKDYIVKGECTLSIDVTTEQAMSQSLKQLMAAGAYTIMSADVKKYGDKDMWHYELSAK